MVSRASRLDPQWAPIKREADLIIISTLPGSARGACPVLTGCAGRFAFLTRSVFCIINTIGQGVKEFCPIFFLLCVKGSPGVSMPVHTQLGKFVFPLEITGDNG